MNQYQLNRPNRFWKNVVRRSTAWLLMASTALTGCATMRPKSLMPSWVETSGKVDAKLAYAQLCERHGQSKEAVSIYEALVKGRNKEGRQSAMHRLAVMAAKRGDFERADEYFKMASAAGDVTAELLNDLGYCYYLQDRFDEAIACFNGALEKEPESKSALNNLGLAYGQQGKFDKALVAFQRAGNDAHVHTNMAYVFSQQNQLEQAQKHYLKAIALDKNNRAAAEGLVQVASATRNRKFDGPKIRGAEDSTLASHTPPQSKPVGNPAELAEVVDLPLRAKSVEPVTATVSAAAPAALLAETSEGAGSPTQSPALAQGGSNPASRWSNMIFQPNLAAKQEVPTLAPPKSLSGNGQKPASVVVSATPVVAAEASPAAAAPRLESQAKAPGTLEAATKKSSPLVAVMSNIPGTASMMDPVAPKSPSPSADSVASTFSTPKLPENLPALVMKAPSNTAAQVAQSDQVHRAAAKPVDVSTPTVTAKPVTSNPGGTRSSSGIFAKSKPASLNDFAAKTMAPKTEKTHPEQPSVGVVDAAKSATPAKHELLTLKPDVPATTPEKPDLAQPTSSLWGKSFSPFKTGDVGKRIATNKQPSNRPTESSMAALEAKLFEVRPIREQREPDQTMVARRAESDKAIETAPLPPATRAESLNVEPVNHTAQVQLPASNVAKQAPSSHAAQRIAASPSPLSISEPISAKGTIVNNPFATPVVARDVAAANEAAKLESTKPTHDSAAPKIVLGGIQPDPLLAPSTLPTTTPVTPRVDLDVAKRLIPVSRSATVAAKPRPVVSEATSNVATTYTQKSIKSTVAAVAPTSPTSSAQPVPTAMKPTLFDSNALNQPNKVKPTTVATERLPVVERIPAVVAPAFNPLQPTIVPTSKEEPIVKTPSTRVTPTPSASEQGELPSASQALAPKSTKAASSETTKPSVAPSATVAPPSASRITPAAQPARITKPKSSGMAVVSDADSTSTQATSTANQPMAVVSDQSTSSPASTAPMAFATDAAPQGNTLRASQPPTSTVTPGITTPHPLREAAQKLPNAPSSLDNRSSATPDVQPKNVVPMTVTPPSVLPSMPTTSVTTKSKQPKSAATAYASDRFERLRPNATLPATAASTNGGVAFATDGVNSSSVKPKPMSDTPAPAVGKAAPSINQTPDVTPPNLATPPLRLEIIGKPNASGQTTSISKPQMPVVTDYQPGSSLNNLNQPSPMKSLGLGLEKTSIDGFTGNLQP